jgi:hypothetical protein
MVAVGPPVGPVVRVGLGLVRVGLGLVPVVPGPTPPVGELVVARGLTHEAAPVPVPPGTPGAVVRVGLVGVVRVAVGDPVVVPPGTPGEPVVPPPPPPVGGAISLGSGGTSVGCATGDFVVPVATPAVVKIAATATTGTMSAAATPRPVRPRIRCSGIVIPPRVLKGPQASTPNCGHGTLRWSLDPHIDMRNHIRRGACDARAPRDGRHTS